jgi:hypothetical protein
MVEILETRYKYLLKNYQGSVCCVDCRTNTSLMMAHHQAHLGSTALQVCCLTCRQFFVSSLSTGAIIAHNVRSPTNCLYIMSLPNGIRSRSPRSRCPGSASPSHSTAQSQVSGMRSSFFSMLSTVRCYGRNPYLYLRVAGRAVGAEFSRHATAQQTFAVAAFPDGVQVHWVNDNAMEGYEATGYNPSNGALKDTKPS